VVLKVILTFILFYQLNQKYVHLSENYNISMIAEIKVV